MTPRKRTGGVESLMSGGVPFTITIVETLIAGPLYDGPLYDACKLVAVYKPVQFSSKRRLSTITVSLNDHSIPQDTPTDF